MDDQATQLFFIPGQILDSHEPLKRYLPIIPVGVVSEWLNKNLEPGSWVLDPFGTSPRLPAESARAGYRILVAANNPISRFLIEMHTNPPKENELRGALANLAAAQKAGDRIEPLIRSLYFTACDNCGYKIEADAFIWERESQALLARIYQCPNCLDSGEHPATQEDIEHATYFSSSALHRTRALERVTPLDDPDREYAEEALDMYLPRTLYALFTLVNKIEVISPQHRKLLWGLLLSTFDMTNIMWHYPHKVFRPHQLTIPTRFIENNVWLALERSVNEWEDVTIGGGDGDIPTTIWPEIPPNQGGICIFEGRSKELIQAFRKSDHFDERKKTRIYFDSVVFALPRPNQAFWTLSALWSGWLWGNEASAQFKGVLRRRRYDWGWHTVALHTALRNLSKMLDSEIPCFGIIGEAEPNFLTAAIISANLADLKLQILNLRSESNQAQLHWLFPAKNSTLTPKGSSDEIKENPQRIIQNATNDFLFKRGEPVDYIHLHSRALMAIAQQQKILQELSKQSSPAEVLRFLEDEIQSALSAPGNYSRFGSSSRSLDVGYWWLNELIEKEIAHDIGLSLADRVELDIYNFLCENPACFLHDVDLAICKNFTGLFTPEYALIAECLYSYADNKSSNSNRWDLRVQDSLQARITDLVKIRGLISQIGKRIGFTVHEPDRQIGINPFMDSHHLSWLDPNSDIEYKFFIQASGLMGTINPSETRSQKIIGEDLLVEQRPNILVIPGGRAALVGYKLRSNPKLRSLIETSWQIIKFRHVRWLSKNENLFRENLPDLLSLDPLANRDPQMQLL